MRKSTSAAIWALFWDLFFMTLGVWLVFATLHHAHVTPAQVNAWEAVVIGIGARVVLRTGT